ARGRGRRLAWTGDDFCGDRTGGPGGNRRLRVPRLPTQADAAGYGLPALRIVSGASDLAGLAPRGNSRLGVRYRVQISGRYVPANHLSEALPQRRNRSLAKGSGFRGDLHDGDSRSLHLVLHWTRFSAGDTPPSNNFASLPRRRPQTSPAKVN